MDLELISDHNAGRDLFEADPNTYPDPLCGGNAECETMCDTYCGTLPGSFTSIASACEGYCQSGAREDLPCNSDGDCPGGFCAGGEPVTHTNVCGCECLEAGGSPGRPGALTCQVGLQFVIESFPPCDATDAILVFPQTCIPLTTETAHGVILDANETPGATIDGPVSLGVPADCSMLASGVATGIKLTGQRAFFDSNLGDVGAPITIQLQ